MRPVLAITMGDVNGVGPEVLAKALARAEVWAQCRPVVVGSAEILEAAGRDVAGFPGVRAVARLEEVALEDGGCAVLDGGFGAPAYRPGTLDAEAGRCAVAGIKLAVAWAMGGGVAGVVTCPINKEGIHRAGCRYAGHTDLIAAMTSSPDYRMCLFAGPMRVVHNTGHCSLREAIAAVTQERVAGSIRIGHEALVRLGLPQRRIGVAALNPHAGEAGAFGSESAEVIGPAIETCQAAGMACSGPHPADTVFRRMRAGEFELVVAMYHDQGHIPMKLIAMDEGVNVTLGIPIVRTSVDHGTAYDIAGKGVAHECSLCAAIGLAAEFAGHG